MLENSRLHKVTAKKREIFQFVRLKCKKNSI